MISNKNATIGPLFQKLYLSTLQDNKIGQICTPFALLKDKMLSALEAKTAKISQFWPHLLTILHQLICRGVANSGTTCSSTVVVDPHYLGASAVVARWHCNNILCITPYIKHYFIFSHFPNNAVFHRSKFEKPLSMFILRLFVIAYVQS